MVSRENAVIGACIAATVAVLVAVGSLWSASTQVGAVITIGGGVLLPLAINGYLDRRDGSSAD